MAIWDVTDGNPTPARRINDYATSTTFETAPYQWHNAIKGSDDYWDVYHYYHSGKAACTRVSASETSVDAPTISGVSANTTYYGSKTVTITCPSSITVNGKSLGITLYYSTNGGSSYSTSTTGSATVNLNTAGTYNIWAYAKLTNYDNVSTTKKVASVTIAAPAAPSITPAANPFNNSTTVTMTCGTSGATIYYTTDGSTTPTTSSSSYSSALPCSATTTYKARAYIGGLYSGTTTVTVTRNANAANVTFSPADGAVLNNPTTISLACSSSGATIYYGDSSSPATAGSSVPNFDSNSSSCTRTLYAQARGGNFSDGAVTSATYTFKCALPTLSVGGGTYTAPQTVTITSATDGATIYYSTGSGFNTLANGGSITISESCSLSVYATKANYQDSEFYMTSYTINATPDGSVSNLALAYSPVIGKSANNPTADLIRFDGTVSFTAAPATSNGWTLDKYVVTITDGTHYAQNVSGANFNALVMNADVTTIAAQNFKVGSTYTVSIAARYVKSGEEPYDVTAATSSVNLDEYATYSPSMSVKTFVQPSQEQSVWWGGESHKCYFDVYRVELSINNAEAVSTIPVSYYQLQVSKDNGTTWENVVDRTIDNLLDPSDNPATTYPAISGATSANRFPGNYNFNANKTESPSGEGEISLSFYYAFDVTSSVSPLSVSDSSQDNPGVWRYRLTTVYGAGENVTTAEGTPVTVDASMIQYSDGMSSSSPEVDAINAESPIITGVDGVAVDRNVKEIRFFDMRGVRLNEAPSSGFYIEVKLMNDGSIRTNKRVAR